MRGVECSEQHMYVSETRFVTMHRHRRHHVHGESPCERCVEVYSPLIHDANGCSQLFLLIALDHPLMRFPNSTRIHPHNHIQIPHGPSLESNCGCLRSGRGGVAPHVYNRAPSLPH